MSHARNASRCRLGGLVLVLVMVAGCAADPPAVDEDAIDELIVTGRAELQPSGNRVIAGRGALDRAEPVIVALPDTPELVLPVLGRGRVGSWVVQLASGERLLVDPGRGADPTVSRFEPGSLVTATTIDAGVDDPLPDGRAVTSGRFTAVLVEPTDRYGHGVLGDRIEAAAVEVVDLDSGTRTRFGPDEPTVIEGLAPILADVVGDERPEILVTHSNGDVGASLALWSVDGELLATSAPIGQGNRWRNQLAIAETGPAGELEIIDVRTPHLRGVVQYFHLDGDELTLAASIPDFTSHVLGSRNLDLGIVADADGDGVLDVVLPTDSRRSLAALTRTTDGVEVRMTVELDGRLTTNVGAVADEDGTITFAVGTDADTITIWPGEAGR